MFWWTLGFFTDEKDSVCIEVPMRDLEAMNCLMIRKAYVSILFFILFYFFPFS